MPPVATRYALVLDAGSSGSRLRIFEWESTAASQLPRIREIDKPSAHARHQAECLRKRPGLSAYARAPDRAAQQVSELIECAQRLVPPAQHSTTPLFIKATAGLRLLRHEAADNILEAVRNAMHAACPFDFRGARIISGEDEATFGWLSVNHLHAALDGDGGRDRGRGGGWLDLGGASAQIAFELGDGRDASSTSAAAYTRAAVITEEAISLPSGGVHLYRRSHLSYGREAAFKRTCRLLREDEREMRERLRQRNRRRASDAAEDAEYAPISLDEGESMPGARRIDHPCLLRGDRISLRLGSGSGANHANQLPLPPPVGAAMARQLSVVRAARHAVHNWTFIGSGDAEQCGRLMGRLLPGPRADEGASSAGGGGGGSHAHPYSGRFYAASNYYHTARFLGLLAGPSGALDDDKNGKGGGGDAVAPTAVATLSAHDYASGANASCGSSWHDVRARWPSSEWRHLRFVCFSGLYISRLLTTHYGVPLTARALTTTNSIEHTTLDWTLGSLLDELYLHQGQQKQPRAATMGDARALAERPTTRGVEAASSSWCPLYLVGLLPTGICVLSSSWALALALVAWAVGLVGLRRMRRPQPGPRSREMKALSKLSPEPRTTMRERGAERQSFQVTA